MKENNIYDPEDLERLLASKSFHDLLPEEKAFVLQYVENDLEYDSMRKSILSFNKIPEIEPIIQPKAATRDSLISAFEAAHGEEKENRLAAFWIWFWDTNKAIFARPAFQLASLALVVSLGYYVSTFSLTDPMAENVSHKEELNKDSEKSNPTTSDKKIESDKNSVVEKEVKIYKDKTESKIVPTADIEDEKELVVDEIQLDSDEATNSGKEFVDESGYTYYDDSSVMITEEDVAEMNEELSESEISTKDLIEIADTDVVLEETALDDLSLEYDARTYMGNSSLERLEAPEMTRSTAELEVISEAKKSASDNSSMAETASAYSSLISKLYTSN